MRILITLQLPPDTAFALPSDNWGVMSDTVLTVPVSCVLQQHCIQYTYTGIRHQGWIASLSHHTTIGYYQSRLFRTSTCFYECSVHLYLDFWYPFPCIMIGCYQLDYLQPQEHFFPSCLSPSWTLMLSTSFSVILCLCGFFLLLAGLVVVGLYNRSRSLPVSYTCGV